MLQFILVLEDILKSIVSRAISSGLPIQPTPPFLRLFLGSTMARRVAPEFVTAYTVSEAQSPAPSSWGKPRLGHPEENLTVEEIYIAPPLPRRPDYKYGHWYNSSRSRHWAPPSMPVDNREEYHEHPIAECRVDEGDRYNRVSSQEQYRHQWRARSPQISESSSTCSAADCEECTFAGLRGHLDDGTRRRNNPVPYVIVPSNGVDSRTMPPSRVVPMYPGAHARQTPQPYHLRNSPRHYDTSPTRETSLADNTALVPSSHNQMMLFHGTTWSGGSEGRGVSDEVSVMHPSASSPRWSEIGQRYGCRSELRSDMQSQSPPTSLGGLYEQSDPRFIQVRPSPRGHIQRPVVIARSNEIYETRRFEEGPYDGYLDEYSESGSDRQYTESERSCSSSDRDEHYSRDYERRYW